MDVRMSEKSFGINWTLLVDRIAEQSWLDPAADAVKTGIHKVYDAVGPAATPLKNFLHGTWLGHPLHPVLTDITVGAYTTTAVLDLAEAGGAKEIALAIDLALATGLTSGLAAAVAGATDWHVLRGKPKRIGFLHMLLNVTSTLLYIASFIVRKSGNRQLGRALGFTAYGVIFGGAYLGGHLVFVKNIGVDHSAEWEQTDEYKKVMPVDDLAIGELHKVMLNETPVVVLRHGNIVVAMSDSCAHEGCSLSERGEIEGDSIRCTCHGSRYRLEDGKVLEGPSAHWQPVYAVRIRGGQIEVRQPSE